MHGALTVNDWTRKLPSMTDTYTHLVLSFGTCCVRNNNIHHLIISHLTCQHQQWNHSLLIKYTSHGEGYSETTE